MRTKKTLLALCAALLILAGCSNESPASSADTSSPNAQASSDSDSQVEEAPTSEVSGELTLEEVLAAEETDASEFQYSPSATGEGIFISGCTSDDDIIVIPEEIDGQPVVSMGINGVNLLDCRALVLPDSMGYLEDGSIGVLDNLEILVYGSGLQEGIDTPTAIYPNLKIVYVQEGAKNIPGLMACGADKLEKVYLPASLEQTAVDNSMVILQCGDPTFVVPAGSAAEQYAIDNGYKYENP